MSKTTKTQVANKAQETKTKAVKQAKKIAKTTKKGSHQVKKHNIYTKVRFYRPKTQRASRNPKYNRSSVSAHTIKVTTDKYDVIKYPLNTEKAMKKIEEENTIVFIVADRATKPQIKQAFSSIYNTKVRNVNTVIRADGKKKAYIRLRAESDALNLANKIGMI